MDKFGNAFESTDWEKAAEGLHVHERCYITLASELSHNLGRERKKMLKNLQRSLSNKNCRKKNVNHHHLNVCDKCVWCLKVFDKTMLLEKLKNWCVYQLFRDQLLRYHLDRVNYLSYLLNHYNLKRHPSPTGCGWKHINGKCRPIRYAVPATAGVLQPQPQVLSDDDDDERSDGEYGDNSENCGTDSEWYKKFNVIHLTLFISDFNAL